LVLIEVTPENDHQIDVLANVTPVGYAVGRGALNAVLDGLTKVPLSRGVTLSREESAQVRKHPVFKLPDFRLREYFELFRANRQHGIALH